ncbi:MAG: phosphoribosylaminoimidazolesuccinocarboxamide synthase [Ignavibacteriaceae bacterium]
MFDDFFVINEKTRKKIKGYGELSAKTNAFFHDYIKGYNIPTAFEHVLENGSLKFSPTVEFPVYIKILNTSSTDLSRIFALEKNAPLQVPLFENYLTADSNYQLNEHHIISFNILPLADFKMMGRIATKVNVILKSFFERRNLLLSEMRCTFGKSGEKVVLMGQFCPHLIKLHLKDAPEKEFEITTPSSIKKYLELFQESVQH